MGKNCARGFEYGRGPYTLVPEAFFSLGATKLSGDGKSRSGEKKTSGTNG